MTASSRIFAEADVSASHSLMPKSGVLRRRVYLGVAAGAVFAFISASLVGAYSAKLEARNKIVQLVARANDAMQLLDREVEASRALLLGLASSPSLLDGDIREFHAQMKRTQVPTGSHLVLSDVERQIANSNTRFGADLPSLTVYKPQPDFYEKLRSAGFYVSGIIYGPVAQIRAATVSVSILDDSSDIEYILTSSLTVDRLDKIMSQLAQISGLDVIVVDHDDNILFGDDNLLDSIGIDGLNFELSADGYFGRFKYISDNDGEYFGVANVPSSVSMWNTYAIMPRDMIDGSFYKFLNLIFFSFLFFSIFCFFIYRLLKRGIENPIEDMETIVQTSQKSIDALRTGITDVRQEEHRRIAQELHDTTAQHLVAADLYLGVLERNVPSRTGGDEVVRELQVLVKRALRELRSFSFLLRPMLDSAGDMREVLKDLCEGYCERAELDCSMEIDASIGRLSPEFQAGVLKVVREALTNIHRHAAAHRVAMSFRRHVDCLYLQISDDGRGGISFPSGGSSARVGLGVVGMEQSVRSLNGTLAISDTKTGTLISVWFPFPDSAVRA
ncbi:histidine kinase [Nitratireductor aquimarinus]|uniref:Histidine kinase n=1 Tax=Nitratireductor aquimarinus TaxID=889300 RepID=A0ABU4AFG5_9HYPH|nr:histidine kinase [Nitratireductor aquimarinus]MDV6224856.1 histidine kinase [Nitratireductor aquimarinus]